MTVPALLQADASREQRPMQDHHGRMSRIRASRDPGALQ